MEFHVHTNASLLAMGVMLFQNVTRKSDQLIVYASRLLNKAKQNYSTIERGFNNGFCFAQVQTLFVGCKFVFYVDHMALVYLVNKPQVSGRIIRWLLLFRNYDFTIMYKPSRTHVVANALSRLLDITKPIGVPDQITNASMSYIQPKWLNDVIFIKKT